MPVTKIRPVRSPGNGSRSVYREERYHNKGGERERDVAKFFWFMKQNFQVTRLMTYLS